MFPLEKRIIGARRVMPISSEKGYAHIITCMGHTVGDSKINSIQNGLLLRSDIHKAFDD